MVTRISCGEHRQSGDETKPYLRQERAIELWAEPNFAASTGETAVHGL